MIERDAPVRDHAWLAAVHCIECCVLCGEPCIQAAHRNEGKGGGQKVDDCLTAALCPGCHYLIDFGKDLTRPMRRALLDRAIVLTLRELVRRGLVVASPAR